jgi:STE24 endopeptidase
MSDDQLRDANNGDGSAGRSPADAKRYARRRYALFFAHLLVGVGFLAAMIGGGSSMLAREAEYIAGPDSFYGKVFWYFTGFSLAYMALTLPLTFYREFILERRFGLSDQTLGHWAGRRIKKWLLSYVVAAPMVVLVYAVLRGWPRAWWIPVSAVWIFFSYVLTKFGPRVVAPLFFKLERIADVRLGARLAGLAAQAGVKLEGIYRSDLSRTSKKANAAVVGLGSTRRVVLADTLLDHFTRREIAVVFAHELGHVVRHHLLKGFLLAGALLTGGFYVGSIVLGRAARALDIPASSAAVDSPVANPETLPILVAVLAGIQLVVMPFEKWYSRRRELESDRFALRATGDLEAFTTAMTKLGLLNLADSNPNKLAEIFLLSHPPITRRIELARQSRAQWA